MATENYKAQDQNQGTEPIGTQTVDMEAFMEMKEKLTALEAKDNGDRQTPEIIQQQTPSQKVKVVDDYREGFDIDASNSGPGDKIVDSDARLWMASRIRQDYIEDHYFDDKASGQIIKDAAEDGTIFSEGAYDDKGKLLVKPINKQPEQAFCNTIADKFKDEYDQTGKTQGYIFSNHRNSSKREGQPVTLFDIYELIEQRKLDAQTPEGQKPQLVDSEVVQDKLVSDVELYLGDTKPKTDREKNFGIKWNFLRDYKIQEIRQAVAGLLDQEHVGPLMSDIRTGNVQYHVPKLELMFANYKKEHSVEADELMKKVADILEPNQNNTKRLRKRLAKDVNNLIEACAQDKYNLEGRLELAKRLEKDAEYNIDHKTAFDIFETDTEYDLKYSADFRELKTYIENIYQARTKVEDKISKKNKEIHDKTLLLPAPGQEGQVGEIAIMNIKNEIAELREERLELKIIKLNKIQEKSINRKAEARHRKTTLQIGYVEQETIETKAGVKTNKKLAFSNMGNTIVIGSLLALLIYQNAGNFTRTAQETWNNFQNKAKTAYGLVIKTKNELLKEKEGTIFEHEKTIVEQDGTIVGLEGTVEEVTNDLGKTKDDLGKTVDKLDQTTEELGQTSEKLEKTEEEKGLWKDNYDKTVKLMDLIKSKFKGKK